MLLKAHSEEEYFSFYGVSPRKGLFCSPLRGDRNPTCSFYRNRAGVLKFKDFGTGDNFDFVHLVMYRFGCDYNEALKIIAIDFGIIQKEGAVKNVPVFKYNKVEIEPQKTASIQCEIRDFNQVDLDWWGSFGITLPTLKRFKVYAVKNVFLNGDLLCSESLSNPIYGYYFGKKDGIEQWKIYFPKRKKHRFLLNCSEIQGLNKIPENGEYIVVTKSYKDVMTLYELKIPAIAPQAESVIISDDVYNKISSRFKYVIFNGDWDRAGQAFMIKSTIKYKGFAMSIKNKEKFGKDISDFVSIHGIEKARKLISIIEDRLRSGVYNHQLIRWQKKQTAKNNQKSMELKTDELAQNMS